MKKHLLAALIFGSICTLWVKAQVSLTPPQVVVDNSKIKVTKYVSITGQGVCGKVVHSHPAHLTVVLTDADVTIIQNGKTVTKHVPAGTSFWSPAETHEVINSGKKPIESLIIVPKN